jgi:sirohydrochlorin cobaltochelatase
LKPNSQSKESNEIIGILLIGHGSSIPKGNDVVFKLSEMYKEMSDYPVEVGFMNIVEPSIPKAVNMLAKIGVTKIIAMPVFLAHGLHTKKDIPYMLGIGEAREDASYYNKKQDKIEFNGRIIYAEPIGADKRIVEVIGKKVEDALNS